MVRANQNSKRDKELVQLCANAKVLLLKLRTYYSKLKKDTKNSEGERYSDLELDPEEECTNEYDPMYSIVTPEKCSPLPWIKNMSTLILCELWLNGDTFRREVVCTLLGLDETLLSNTYSDILREWVIANRGVVNVIKSFRLEDRLSKALLQCLDYTSTEMWKRSILECFADSEAFEARDTAKHAMHVPDARLDTSRVPKTKLKSCARKTEERVWLSEAEESNSDEHEEDGDDDDIEDLYGETLTDTMSNDENQSPDEYDSIDSFINDGPLETVSSSEEMEGSHSQSRKVKRAHGKRITGRKGYKHTRISRSESEEENPHCSNVEEDSVMYTRTFQSDSDNESTKPEVQHGKKRKSSVTGYSAAKSRKSISQKGKFTRITESSESDEDISPVTELGKTCERATGQTGTRSHSEEDSDEDKGEESKLSYPIKAHGTAKHGFQPVRKLLMGGKRASGALKRRATNSDSPSSQCYGKLKDSEAYMSKAKGCPSQYGEASTPQTKRVKRVDTKGNARKDIGKRDRLSKSKRVKCTKGSFQDNKECGDTQNDHKEQDPIEVSHPDPGSTKEHIGISEPCPRDTAVITDT